MNTFLLLRYEKIIDFEHCCEERAQTLAFARKSTDCPNTQASARAEIRDHVARKAFDAPP